MLYQTSGYLHADVVVEGDEPMEGELAEDLADLLDYIEEQASAVNG